MNLDDESLILRGFGAVTLGLAVLAVGADIVGTALFGPVSALDDALIVLAFGLTLVLGGYIFLYVLDEDTADRETDAQRSADADSADDDQVDWFETDEKPAGFEADEETIGRRIDSVLGYVETRLHPGADRKELRREVSRIRYKLRERAVDVVALRDDCSSEEAERRVAEGSWTDDPRAATFLQESSQARMPVRAQVGDWLQGKHLHRRVRATVEAIAAATPGGVADADPITGRDLESNGHGRQTQMGEQSDIEGTDADDPTGGTYSEVRLETEADVRDSRHTVGLAVGLGATLIGTALGNAAVVLSGIVGFVYLAYGYVLSDPSYELVVGRTLGNATPNPGQRVAVSLTVRNVGETPIAGLRVRDGVPEDLSVVDGTVGLATSLQPDEKRTVTYYLEATPGEYEFDPVKLAVENLAGSALGMEQTRIETPLTCRLETDDVPLSGQTTPFQGQVPTDASGSGIEFYATREYVHGDPMNRIDWNRFASTRELTTIEFREHRAAIVVVVLDARTASTVARRPAEGDAVALGERATVRLIEQLLDQHNDVGTARLKATSEFNDDVTEATYLPPSTDPLQTMRARRVALDEGTVDGQVRPMTLRWVSEFATTLPEKTQVVFVSPLLADEATANVERLLASGHDVTVLVPDVLPVDTPGGTLDRTVRSLRVSRLREWGVSVVPWDPDEHLSVALARPTRRGESHR